MKTTSKKTLVIISIILGAAAGICRAFASQTVFWAVTAVSVAAFAALSAARGRQPAPESRENTERFKLKSVMAAIILLASILYECVGAVSSGVDLLTACVMALGVVTAAGMIVSASQPESEKAAVFASMPVFFLCILILKIYKQYAAACPRVGVYAVEILAATFLTLGVYFIASMRFSGLSDSFPISFSSMAAVFFAFLVLISTVLTAGSHRFVLSLGQVGAYVSCAVYCAAWYLDPPTAYYAGEDDDTAENGNDGDAEPAAE